MEQPPPRFGDWSSANRHLTAGGTVEGIVRDNPYREYYLSLHKKNMEKEAIKREINDIEFALATCDHITGGMQADAEDRLELLQQMLDNPCTKPHNNGEDTCNECQVIKKGV